MMEESKTNLGTRLLTFEGLYPLEIKRFGIDTITQIVTDDNLLHFAKHPSLVGAL